MLGILYLVLTGRALWVISLRVPHDSGVGAYRHISSWFPKNIQRNLPGPVLSRRLHLLRPILGRSQSSLSKQVLLPLHLQLTVPLPFPSISPDPGIGYLLLSVWLLSREQWVINQARGPQTLDQKFSTFLWSMASFGSFRKPIDLFSE